MTKNNVQSTATGRSDKIYSRGTYINFYIANKVVLVPNYDDPNDEVAMGIIKKYYSGR